MVYKLLVRPWWVNQAKKFLKICAQQASPISILVRVTIIPLYFLFFIINDEFQFVSLFLQEEAGRKSLQFTLL